MKPHLVTPREAADRVARALGERWAEAVCAAHEGLDREPFVVSLSPGVRSGSDIERLGYATRSDWLADWDELDVVDGVRIERKTVRVVGVDEHLPRRLVVDDVDAAAEWLDVLGHAVPTPDLARARRVLQLLDGRGGARVTPSVLRALLRLEDEDVIVAAEAVQYLSARPQLGDLTERQHTIPGAHTKWLRAHRALMTSLLGRDVLAEVKRRPPIAHLTYVDPSYLASGHRRHDAWTGGDTHVLAYAPDVVLVVENRDCRLAFPPVDGTVVVEGGGDAATAVLAEIPWLRQARTIAYWGDIDTAGFEILDAFRSALARPGPDGLPPRRLESILMDEQALVRYEDLGVSRDRHGAPIPPSRTLLHHLDDQEWLAYARVATRGPVSVRRIEQERISCADAAEALLEKASRR